MHHYLGRYLLQQDIAPAYSVAIGHAEAPVLAISTSSPFLNWSVLLCGNDNLAICCEISRLQALTCRASSDLKNPANSIKLMMVILKLARVGEDLVSSIMSERICTSTGFFSTGLACMCFRPWRVVWTKGLVVGDSNQAILCTHANAWTASFTGNFNCNRNTCK